MNAALLVTCISSTLPEVSSAQVEWKDRSGTVAAGTQQNHSIARASNERFTVVVWEDFRNGEQADIYAQKLENGNGIPVWYPGDGVPICTADGDQRNPRAAYDSLGGVVITWEDYREDAGNFDPDHSLSDIYAVRILLSTGEIDQNWGSEKRVCDVASQFASMARNPRLVGIGAGAVITWTDYRNSSGYPYYNNRDVFAQFVRSADGGYNWNQDGNCVSEQPEMDQQHPEIVADSIFYDEAMGVVISYEDNRTDVFQIWANRLNAQGQSMWGDLYVAPPTNAQAQNPQQLKHRMDPAPASTEDLHLGVIIAWQDERDRENRGTEIYMQRVDIESGVSLWPDPNDPLGIQVSDGAGDQLHPRIDVEGEYAVIAWEDERNGEWDIFANRAVSNDGGLLSGGGVAVCIADEDQINVDVECKGDTATLCWEDYRRYPQSDIYVQEIGTGSWSEHWGTDGIPVTLAKTTQLKPEVGKRVFVYMDDRRDEIAMDTQDDMNIYAQKLGDPCDAPTNMHWKDVLAKWTLDTDASDHRFATDTDGNTYVVWYEDRNIPLYDIDQPGVYIQKFDRDGVPRWTNGGIALSDTTVPSGKPDVCIGDNGAAIATWYETVSGTDRVVVRKIHTDGSTQWTAVASVTPGTNPRIVEDESGGAYIAYESNDIQVCRMNSVGSEVFNLPLDPNGPGGNLMPLIVRDRQAGCYVVGNDQSTSIYAAHFNLNGWDDTDPTHASITVDSYDMSTDAILNGYTTYDALLATTDGENIFVQKLRFSQQNGLEIFPFGPASLLYNGTAPDVYLSQPVIDYDSASVSYGADQGGGAIIAWNRKYRISPQSQVFHHKVYTTSVDWNLGGNPVTRLPGWPIDVSMACFEETQPDISKEINRNVRIGGGGGVGSYGFVVWHEYAERSCEYKAVAAQEVDYTADLAAFPPQQPRQWDPDGVLLSPQSGAVEQYTPYIRMAQGDTAAVYWLDTRAGDPLLVGTQLSSRDHALVLSKRAPVVGLPEAASMSLGQNHPNPFHTEGSTMIAFHLESDAVVLLRVTDLLGREVAVVASGALSRGDHSAVFAPGRIPPGVYMYTLSAQGRAITRSMLLVR